MAEWIYFIYPPRENVGETMTDEETAVWSIHFDRFQRLLGELRPFRISLLRGRDPGDAQAGLSPEVEGHPPD